MKKRFLAILLCLCMVAVLLPTTALAADDVKYIDRGWDSTEKKVTAIERTANNVTEVAESTDAVAWGGDGTGEYWYVVNSNVTISGRITVTGDVRLILADGCTLKASAGITVEGTNALSIYGQSGGTGKLEANSTNNAAIGGGNDGGNGGTVNVHGGRVSAESNNGAGIGGGFGAYAGDGGSGGTVSIYGGTVTAESSGGAGIGGGSGGTYGGSGGTVYIYGGEITAQSKDFSAIGGAGGDHADVYIYPAKGTQITVKHGADSDSASEIKGSPFQSGTTINIRDITIINKYFHSESEALPSAIQSGIGSLAYGDTVYYGEYTDTSATPSKSYDVPWYIIGSNGVVKKTLDASLTSLFLLSQYTLGSSEFRSKDGYYAHDTSGNVSDSDLKITMDGLYTGSSTTLFTASEQSAIKKTKLTGDSMYIGVSDVDAYLFPLSLPLSEAGGIGWGDNLLKAKSITDQTGAAGPWWLRISSAAGNAHCVDGGGGYYDDYVYLTRGVRPAFNLNLSSVLFTSAAEGGKSTSGMDGALTAVGATATTEWKLTLTDSERSSFAAATTAINSSTLTVAYSGAKTGTNEYISAVIKNGSGDITYYGRIAQPAAADGTVNITLPSGFDSAADTLYIFNEQYNGDYKTDYASELKEVSLTKNAYAITNNLTNISTSNAATYRLMSDTADYNATLTADTNYKLPTNITVNVGGNPLEAGTDYEYDSTNGSLTISPEAINGDIEIVAAGVRNSTGGGGTTYYTLRFDANGGSEIDSIRRAYGTTVDLSGYTTTREGYTFNGWYADEELTDRITSIRMTGSKTVYAGWTENAAPVDNPFTDVSESDWFYDDVMFVYAKGLMVGVSDTLFDPYGTTTRAMTATTIWRMEGSPAPEGGNPFTDVKNGEWYTDAILWAAENEIAVGYGGGLFGTNDPVTREQLAAMFYRYAEYKGYDTTITGSIDRFTDKGDISDWAVDAMKWAVGYGLIQGKDNNILDPQGYATRAEFAAMLHRFIEKNELEEGITATGLMGWIDPKRTIGIPQTGDSASTTLWTSALLFSLAACAVLTLTLKRRREEEADGGLLVNP